MTLWMHFPEISRSLLHEVVFRKLCARWVPKNLTDRQRKEHQGSALEFLTRCNDEVITLKTYRHWVWDHASHVIPESKPQSMEWRHTTSPTRTKSKPATTYWKILSTEFWDRHGILLVDFYATRSNNQRGCLLHNFENCVTQYRISFEACFSGILFSFMTMHAHTKRLWRNNSLRTSAGNSLNHHPAAPILHQVTVVFFSTLNHFFLASSSR